MKNSRILIADDHPIVLQGIESILKTIGYVNIKKCSNGIEAFNEIVKNNFDLVILDMDMPGLSGLEIATKTLVENPKQKIIILTMHKELSILKKCQQLSIKGYLLKEFAVDEIEMCLNEVLIGRTYYSTNLKNNMQIDKLESAELTQITPSERKILKLISERKTSREIAEMLFISEKTVEKHRSNIIRKLDLPNDKRSLIELSIKLFT